MTRSLAFACLLLGACSEPTPDCIAANPASPPVVEQSEMDRVLADCVADDGTCVASSPCTGTVDGRDCTAEGFISMDAAMCRAATEGLDEGLEGRKASFLYNVGLRRIIWVVTNVLMSDDSSETGDIYFVDAKTGDVLDKAQYSSTE